MPTKPNARPDDPHFSSGPCKKRPGWSWTALEGAFLGRSHRAKDGMARIQEMQDRAKAVLGLDKDYTVIMVPGSDTGAMELALWSMLGARPVDLLSWDVFGKAWATDTVDHLKLADARVLSAPFGEIPDLSQVNPDHDVVFTWNATTSGVRVPNGEWIAADRKGLTICDATSAAYAMDLAWDKLDVTTWSWQKALGGEAAHGMMALSPRAMERLATFTPKDRPLPKIFRLFKDGQFTDELLTGATVNTPSMIVVEDAIDTLKWAEREGGAKGLIARANASSKVLYDWLDQSDWCEALAKDPATRSTTSVTVKITAPWFTALDEAGQRAKVKDLVALLEAEGAALDIGGHRLAPPGLRIWCGPTVEKADVAALLPWLDWGFAELQAKAAA